MAAQAWNSCKEQIEPYAASAFKELGLLPGTPPAEILPFPLQGKGFNYVPSPPQVAEFEMDLAAHAAVPEAPSPANRKPKQLTQLSILAFLKKQKAVFCHSGRLPFCRCSIMQPNAFVLVQFPCHYLGAQISLRNACY